MAPPDPHSFADPAQARTQSVALDLTVDFETQTIHGTALLKLDKQAPGALDLDTRDLTIEKATDGSGAEVPFSLDAPPHPVKGSRLRLSLSSDEVTIAFRTSPTASALQWLAPPQTAGGKEPYLFSQCQAIHARSVFPCQDSPECRITYTAKLRIPSQLRAVMSAKHLGREAAGAEGEGEGAVAVEAFAMENSIPPYLFALAVGDLTHHELSPRVKIYAEPSMVKAAAEEFSGVESWISAAEALFGPYGWEEFNMLLMPPSFPYGGMENPRMTFLTPSLVVGDKSLVNVVAHELAHSWTGNLVTNSNAAHFWLNEGWTVYAERRILEAVEGREEEQLHASVGFADLEDAVHEFEEAERATPGAGLRYTQLDTGEAGLGEVDPDVVFSHVPYEKGFLFLTRLEAAGWTKYAERRILEAVEGPEVNLLSLSEGFLALEESISEFEDLEKREPGKWIRFTQLDPGEEGLGGVDPDVAYSRVPYEKGCLFLLCLESAVGRPAFDAFIAKYIKHFAFKSINTSQFLEFLKSHLPEAAAAVDLEAWVRGRGIPGDAPRPHSASLAVLKDAAAAVAAASAKSEEEQEAGIPRDVSKAWGAREWATFVKFLPRTLSPGMLELLDSTFHFSEKNNLEIATPFLTIAARSGYKKPFPRIEAILKSVGRMKFLKPLYMALVEGGEKEFAKRIYSDARPKYHPVAQTVIDGVLKK